MAIVSLTEDTASACMAQMGVPLSTSRYTLYGRVTADHNVEVRVDGVKSSPTTRFVPAGTTAEFTVYIPADLQPHQVTLVDTGTRGTPASVSPTLTLSSSCDGGLTAWVISDLPDPVTNAPKVMIRFGHGESYTQTIDGRILVDDQPYGTGFQLSETASDYTPTITLPADGRKHVVTAQTRAGSSYAPVPILWYVVNSGNGTDPPPDTSTETAEFVPGETVIIQSKESSTPLATDGSEWVLVDYAPLTGTQWTPAGADGGRIGPDEDGKWSASIATNPTGFPVGSQWQVRARRYRDYQASDTLTHTFTMIAGTVPPDPPPDPPIITTPPGQSQHGGTWMPIKGTGRPGAQVEFNALLTTGGTRYYLPLATTVGQGGEWGTYVFGEHGDAPETHKIIEYRARLHLDGQVSGWSNPLPVTWQRPNR